MSLALRISMCAFVVVTALVGCHHATDTSTATTAPTSKDKIYDVKGKIVALDADNKKVKLDHEAIPGVMGAMIMWFKVDDAKLLQDLKDGDNVQGRFLREGFVIKELKKI